MHARMNNPGFLVPDALKALQAFSGTYAGRLPRTTVEMVNLRASQINGCSVCVEMHARALRQLGLPEEKVFAVGAWRESPYFSDEERAALALAEALTRIADRPIPSSRRKATSRPMRKSCWPTRSASPSRWSSTL